MRNFYYIFIIFFVLIANSQSQNYNFNKSIIAVSSINNSAYKKNKINKYINYFTKTEKGRVFFKQTYTHALKCLLHKKKTKLMS